MLRNNQKHHPGTVRLKEVHAMDYSKLGQVDLKKLPRSDLQTLQHLLTPKMTKYIYHVPQPKQAAFMLLDCKEAFYGGAAGGGKSDCLLMCGLQHVDVKGYAGIIFRKTFADLVKPGALIDRAREWLAPYIQTGEVRWVDKEKKFEFLDKYGPHKDIRSILQFGYLETDNDRYNYQGGEYQFVGFDELTHMSLVNYSYLFSRTRRLKGLDVPIRIRGASNPPDDGQGEWVYNRFVNPETKEPGVVFIPAGLDDNPFLDKEEYLESLSKLDPVTRARLRDGVWTIKRKGNMFKREWFRPINANDLPAGRRRFRFWDLAATELTPAQKRRSSEPDFTVGFQMSEYQGIYYIEDIIHMRGRPAEVEATVRKTAIADGFRTAIRMEEEPGSSGKNNTDNYARKVLHGYNFKGVKPMTDKVTRAMPASAAAERGDVYYVENCRNLNTFFDELESFPGAPHDDLVDGFSGAFNELRQAPVLGIPVTAGDSENSYWDSIEYADSVSSSSSCKIIDLGSRWIL